MPVEDAYKLLKATPGSTWESIEQTRRLLVEQSHPERLKAMAAEKRSSALAEATRANTAYATLSRLRCGGH
jgi:curved DNA-binding protein CbpA